MPMRWTTARLPRSMSTASCRASAGTRWQAASRPTASRPEMRPGLAVLAVLVAALLDAPTAMAQPAPLTLEAKIPLGQVRGRIDHLAIDADRQLLFVAELGNDSVGVGDLRAGTVVRRLSGLSEPQGVGWHARTGTLYVANASDGSV